jgi:hypothetical protein
LPFKCDLQRYNESPLLAFRGYRAAGIVGRDMIQADVVGLCTLNPVDP